MRNGLQSSISKRNKKVINTIFIGLKKMSTSICGSLSNQCTHIKQWWFPQEGDKGGGWAALSGWKHEWRMACCVQGQARLGEVLASTDSYGRPELPTGLIWSEGTPPPAGGGPTWLHSDCWRKWWLWPPDGRPVSSHNVMAVQCTLNSWFSSVGL